MQARQIGNRILIVKDGTASYFVNDELAYEFTGKVFTLSASSTTFYLQVDRLFYTIGHVIKQYSVLTGRVMFCKGLFHLEDAPTHVHFTSGADYYTPNARLSSAMIVDDEIVANMPLGYMSPSGLHCCKDHIGSTMTDEGHGYLRVMWYSPIYGWGEGQVRILNHAVSADGNDLYDCLIEYLPYKNGRFVPPRSMRAAKRAC